MLVARVDAAHKALHPRQAVIQLMAQADHIICWVYLATCIYISFPWHFALLPQGCVVDHRVWQCML